MKAWMKREQWFMWLALVVVLTLVLAAIGYLIGFWARPPGAGGAHQNAPPGPPPPRRACGPAACARLRPETPAGALARGRHRTPSRRDHRPSLRDPSRRSQ